MEDEEESYTVNLVVKVCDRIKVKAKSINSAKRAAKNIFFGKLNEYQAVNSVLESVEVK